MAQLTGTGTGTGDKRKLALAVVLGIVVLALAVHTIFGGPVTTPLPSAVPVRSVNATAAPAASNTRSVSGVAVTGASIDPSLHPELMAENENYQYAGSGRNIFSQTSAPPPRSVAIEEVKAPIRPFSQQPPPSTGPPPPPAIDLKFFGFAARKNGSRRAFLTHGDDVFVASEGDVVSHRYRVVRITPTSIDVEDMGYHNTQTLPLVLN